MTRLLEQAIETVSALPDDVQDDLARILLQFAGVEQPPYVLTPEEEADLNASLAEAERGAWQRIHGIEPCSPEHQRRTDVAGIVGVLGCDPVVGACVEVLDKLVDGGLIARRERRP